MRIHLSAIQIASLAFVLSVLLASSTEARAAQEQARSADTFVESIGICTHWTYGDTPYGFAYTDIKQKLLDSGIRHIRDGFGPRLVELGRLGVKATVLADMDNGEDGNTGHDPARPPAHQGPQRPGRGHRLHRRSQRT